MSRPRLTTKQRELVAEIKELLLTLKLDPDALAAKAKTEDRTVYLENAKDQIIRSAVVLDYVLMDELLNMIICNYYFRENRSFPELWKTKRFQTFNYFVLEKVYLLQKLDLVQFIDEIPKWVASDLRALNDLRNSIAHSYFPQNRRRKPEWKGQSVFTPHGLERFSHDIRKIGRFFGEHFWVIKDESRDKPDVAASLGGAAGTVTPHEGRN